MKKIILVFCLLICLCACKVAEDKELFNDLNNIFDHIDNISTYRINNKMKYYSYYLPSDMNEEALDSESIVLKYNDNKIIMNLNVSNIINTKYYTDHILEDESIFSDDYIIYKKEGKLKTESGQSVAYIFKLYNYKDIYILHLISSNMNYIGTIKKEDITQTLKHLLMIAKNTNVLNEDVIKEYSKKDIIEYKKKQINLFNTSMPVSGTIDSLLVDDAIIGDGIRYDGQIYEDERNEEVPIE